MFHYEYKTKGTCAQIISMDLDGDTVHNIKFMGGCSGNLKTTGILLEGWKVSDIAEKLTGITCGVRDTSCSDQLAAAVLAAYEGQKSGVHTNA